MSCDPNCLLNFIAVEIWAMLFKTGLSQARVIVKFEFRYDSVKSKFVVIVFVYNLMTGCSEKKRKNDMRICF